MAEADKEKPRATDYIEERYTILKRMGEGTYGVVCAAKDVKTGRKVAIKKVKNAVEDVIDAKRILREIKLLKHFRGHENVVGLKDLVTRPDSRNFEDIYIITELMDTDLLQVVKSKQKLTDEHIRYFVYQILRALKLFHSAGVLHRDLKPNNLLANENCDMKVCDFGLARKMESDDETGMTCYVVTRWYRPPELLLGSKEYSKAVDMWSCGCIFAELISRKALFPGKDYIQMIKLIIDVVGTPADADIEFCSDKAKRFLSSLPKKEKVPLASLFPTANPLAIDLLEKLLEFNPSKRISASDALQHPYMAELHDPEDEPDAVGVFDFSFEDQNLTEDELRGLVYKEITEFQAMRAARAQKAAAAAATPSSS